jgi:phosphatidylserine/phosphatidylglycerophosphate/cardiolipin synthase-like enzyme
VALAVAVQAGAQDDASLVRDVADTSRSSWIEHAEFVKATGANAGRLLVRIQGEELAYAEVPVSVWMEFKNADSMGEFYGEQIKNRYERWRGEALGARYDSVLGAAVTAQVQCAFNEECEPLILREIESAHRTIRVAAYAFTRTRIAAALVSAKVRGVDVRMKVDEGQAKYPGAVRQLEYLERNGIPVTRISMKGEYAAMHNKFLVIDERCVIAGSYNFTTTAGAANWENVLWAESPEIAARYTAAWAAIVSE